MRHSILRFFLLPGLVALPFNASRASLPDFAKIVTRTAPVVVNISTQRGSSDSAAGDVPPAIPDASPSPENSDRQLTDSLGSGFIISADGEILTNYHVIENAERISVKLADRRVLPARVLGVDVASDMALLKVDAHHLPVAHIGDARTLAVGQWVLAIGSPFGFDQSVTAGIVSAVGRSIGSEQYVPYIQTDVPINPGNSGGPLLNLKGQVVGINSEIYSRTGGYQGVSFAIPINLAMNVVSQLEKRGHVVRGWLGVNVTDLTQPMAARLHLERPQGALIRGIMRSSPAAHAGMRVGDVILRFDGTEVASSQALPPLVGSTPTGRRVPVEVLSGGRTKTLQVTIAALPASEQAAAVHAALEPPGSFDVLGLSLRALTGSERQAFQLRTGGALVEHVAPGAAQLAGLRPGDILLSLDGKPVRSPAQFQSLEAKLPAAEIVPLLIRRQDSTLFVALQKGDRQ